MITEQTGTITWIPVAEIETKLPKDNIGELGWYSKQVLITDGETVHKTRYAFSASNWVGSHLIGITTTHFAFINLPAQ